MQVIYVNGMTTSFEDARASCDRLNEITGKVAELIHNDSTRDYEVAIVGGCVVAALGASGASLAVEDKKTKRLLQIGGIVAALIAILEYTMIQKRKEAEATKIADRVTHHLDSNPLLEVTLILHSQGADVGQNALCKLSRAYRKKVNVITLGGAVEIPHGLSKTVVNLRNGADLISHVASGLQSAPIPRTVHVVRSATCTTPVCHGASDYLAHAAVERVVRNVAGGKRAFAG